MHKYTMSDDVIELESSAPPSASIGGSSLPPARQIPSSVASEHNAAAPPSTPVATSSLPAIKTASRDVLRYTRKPKILQNAKPTNADLNRNRMDIPSTGLQTVGPPKILDSSWRDKAIKSSKPLVAPIPSSRYKVGMDWASEPLRRASGVWGVAPSSRYSTARQYASLASLP